MAENSALELSDTALLAELQKAVSSSKLTRASTLAQEGIERGLVHPLLYVALGLKAQEDGRDHDALEELTRALALSPGNYVLLNALGVSLVKLKRIEEGIARFDEAIGLQPAFAQSYFRKGWAFEMLGDRRSARCWHEKALRYSPNLAQALGALASLAIRDQEIARCRELAEKALRIDPNEASAIIALARADLADHAFDAAETRLRAALKSPRLDQQTKGLVLGFLGDALDGQEQTTEAFAAYEEGNAINREIFCRRFGSTHDATAFAERLSADVEDASLSWDTPAPPALHSKARTHVFLMGFLRSGTTLLERVLLANSDVASLEERNTFGSLIPRFLSSREGLLQLHALGAEDMAQARAEYWDAVHSFGGDPEDKIFIDKQPLNTLVLPLIAKLFPDARIVFALRDPRDVVLSCFRRHFDPGTATFELLTVEGAARYYAATMRLAEICQARFPLTLLATRYEDLVTDFEVTSGRVCQFIGTEWLDEMRNFSELAKTAQIRSPSIAQVRRPLYEDGVGQWHRYTEFLGPALPILEPWIEKFGYPKS